jgi:hypothetical protein
VESFTYKNDATFLVEPKFVKLIKYVPQVRHQVIVAIHKDKDANIFNVARFGVVADYKQILPALTAKLKELKSA